MFRSLIRRFRSFPLTSPGMVLFTVILGTTLPLADTTSMNVGRLFIARALDSSPDETRWLTAGYSLFVALGIPLSYRLRGFFNERDLYALATAVFMGGSVISMLAHFMPSMMVGRALQGLAGGVLIPLSVALINESHPPEKRARGLALFAIGNAIAVSAGPTLGGLLVDTLGWRWTMGIHLPIGFLTLIFAALSLSNHPRSESVRFDLPGWLLFSTSAFFFMYATTEGERFGWHSATIFWTTAVCLLSFFSYLLWAAFHARPIIPLDLFRHGRYVVLSVANFLRSTAMFGRLYLLPLYLEIFYHFQSHQAGMVIFMGVLTEILIPVFALLIVSGRIFSPWIFMAAGSVLIALANGAYLSLPANIFPLALVLLPQMVFGIGVALTQVSLQPLVIKTLPDPLHRVGMVVQLMIQFLGGMFGVVWARHLLDNASPAFHLALSQTSSPSQSPLGRALADRLSQAFAYNLTFLILGGVSLLAAILAIGLLPVLQEKIAGTVPGQKRTASGKSKTV
jgi:EmrB/QacA subfamily drug resistance transporter